VCASAAFLRQRFRGTLPKRSFLVELGDLHATQGKRTDLELKDGNGPKLNRKDAAEEAGLTKGGMRPTPSLQAHPGQ
jgi:hypothetical protein